MKLRFQVPAVSQPYVGWKASSAEIIRGRDGHLTLHMVVQKEIRRPEPTGQVVGMDLGVNRPAVLSTNRFLGERR